MLFLLQLSTQDNLIIKIFDCYWVKVDTDHTKLHKDAQ